MSLENYSDFRAAIADWMNRTGHSEIEARIPDFLILAQEKINDDLDLTELEAVTTLSVDASSESTPAGVGVIKSISINNCELDQTSVGAINRYRSAGTPVEYDHLGDTIYFGPTPESAVTATIHYEADTSPITSTSTTNWYTANAKGVLLAQALYQAYLYAKDDARADKWMMEYKEKINSRQLKSFRTESKNRRIMDNEIKSYGGPIA